MVSKVGCTMLFCVLHWTALEIHVHLNINQKNALALLDQVPTSSRVAFWCCLCGYICIYVLIW